MKRLLWKEFRENRVWALPLIASTVGVLFLHQGYTFFGNYAVFSPLIGISAIVALLFGTGAYASELSGDKADFLYSRPVSWKRILLAKLTIGFCFILSAAVLSAIVYRLICPDLYVPFATLPALMKGVGLAVLLMGIPYIVGVACSVVFPGFLGGILTLLMVLVLGSLQMLILNETSIVPYATQIIAGEYKANAPYFALLSWPLALLLAGLYTVRSGLTLSTGARVRKYTIVLAIFVVLLIPADMIISCGIAAPQWLNHGTVDNVMISPDGKYALVQSYETLIRLSDKKFVQFRGGNSYQDLGWCGEGKLYFIRKGADRYYSQAKHAYPPAKSNSYLTLIKMDREGKLHQKTINLGYWSWIQAHPSPYSNMIALVGTDFQLRKRSILFVDTAKERILPQIVTVDLRFTRVWWKSKNEIVYFTPSNKLGEEGKRHTLRVVD